MQMEEFLEAIEIYGPDAREALIKKGYHPNVIYRKAEKAAIADFTDFGVSVDRPWLTDKGKAFLATKRPNKLSKQKDI